MGGVSSEREVSLSSGRNIVAALRENGIRYWHRYILPIAQIQTVLEPRPEMLKDGERNLIKLLGEPEIREVDFVFNALHGGSGENGAVQSVLEMMGYKYNGSDHEGCAIAMDKIVSKIIFERHGIPTPQWLSFDLEKWRDAAAISAEIKSQMALPLVIKPAHEGSTVGLSIVQSRMQSTRRWTAMRYNSALWLKRYSRRKSLWPSWEKNLPLVEIRPKHGIYDYECKYTKGLSE
jgi:D-alanine-D-alanine ligase